MCHSGNLSKNMEHFLHDHFTRIKPGETIIPEYYLLSRLYSNFLTIPQLSFIAVKKNQVSYIVVMSL